MRLECKQGTVLKQNIFHHWRQESKVSGQKFHFLNTGLILAMPTLRLQLRKDAATDELPTFPFLKEEASLGGIFPGLSAHLRHGLS